MKNDFTAPPGVKFSGGMPPIDAPPQSDVSFVKRSFLDVPYGKSLSQRLDLFLPDDGDGPFPLLIHIHGGGFAIGDKRDGHMIKLLDAIKKGLALASINYRLSGEAIFPAAVLDCRNALRFLKSNAARFSIDPNRFGVIGGSAGGNLCAMMAMNIPIFEGEEESGSLPEVKAAIDWFGPTDFLRMDSQALENGVSFADHGESNSPESSYIGKTIGEADPSHVQKANPITYISEAMAPLLVEHGRLDKLVPFQQSAILVEEIEKRLGSGRVLFIPLDNADHDDPLFESDENLEIVWAFVKKHQQDA